jgi:hypothetical protein
VSDVIDTSRTGKYVLQLATEMYVDTGVSGPRHIDVRSNPVTVIVVDDGLNTVRRDVRRTEGTRGPRDIVDGDIASTSETEAFWDHETPEKVQLVVGWTNQTPVARNLEVARDPLDDLDIKVLGVSPYLLGTTPGRAHEWGTPKRETPAEMEADDRLGRPAFRRYDNGLIGAAIRDPVGAPISVLLEPGETLRYRVPLSRLFDLSAVGTYLVTVRPRWADQLTGTVTNPPPPIGALKTRMVIRHGRPWQAAFGSVWHG